MTSAAVQSKPEVKAAIKAASRTATDAVLAYDDVTRGCLRDLDTGEIILKVGFQCQPNAARQLLLPALSAMTTLRQYLIDIQAEEGT